MTLEEEALGYTISNGGNKPETFTDEQIGRLHGYIDGANSKWVQAEKLKAQIDLLEEINNWSIRNNQDDATLYAVRMKISSLQQQFTKLDNVTK
jgi:hypothetical protein